MLEKNFKILRSCVLGTITFALLLTFASLTYASQEELDQVDHAIRSRGAYWLARETAISRLPHEKRMMRLGLLTPAVPLSGEVSAPDTSSSTITATAPSSLDWRNYSGHNYVTPVRDQGDCGSCWAFATTAALESNVLITLGSSMDLAEQVLVSCSSGRAGSGGCNGGYIERASNDLRDTGLPPEGYYPYTQTNGLCSTATSGWWNNTSRITSWHYVAGNTSPTPEQIKNELNTYGPLVTTMDVYADFYYYAGGIYKYSYGTYQGGHAVLIVGYDDAGQNFIVKNSWGSGWGESGYFKIAYSELSNSIHFGDWTIAYYTAGQPSPGIRVVTPNGSDSWAAGTTKTIQWSYTANPGAYVKVELYNNEVLSRTLTSSTPVGSGGTGSYNWNIPSTQTQGDRYKIKVTSTDNAAYTDTSDNSFSITLPPSTPPSITVTAPNGGETWKAGSSQTVRWSYKGTPGSLVNIVLLRGASVVKTLSSSTNTGTGGLGSYTWKVPLVQATKNNYRIQVTSTSNKSYTDTSNGYFTISR